MNPRRGARKHGRTEVDGRPPSRQCGRLRIATERVAAQGIGGNPGTRAAPPRTNASPESDRCCSWPVTTRRPATNRRQCPASRSDDTRVIAMEAQHALVAAAGLA